MTTEVFSTHAAAVVEKDSNRGQEKHLSSSGTIPVDLGKLLVPLILFFFLFPFSIAKAGNCETKYFPWRAASDETASVSRRFEPCVFFDWERVTEAFYSSETGDDFARDYLAPAVWGDAFQAYLDFAYKDDRYKSIKSMADFRQALEGRADKDLLMKTNDVVGLFSYWIYASNHLRFTKVLADPFLAGNMKHLAAQWKGWGKWEPLWGNKDGIIFYDPTIYQSTAKMQHHIDWSRFPDWRTDEEKRDDNLAYRNFLAKQLKTEKEIRQLFAQWGIPYPE